MSVVPMITSSKSLSSLLPASALDARQREAIRFAASNDYSLLVLPVGFGKSVVSLSAGAGRCSRILVVAPLSVCLHTWATEHTKWADLAHLTVAVAVGSEKARRAAVDSGSDVLVINPENLRWLSSLYDTAGCDGLIIDELTRFKTVSGQSFKALRRLAKKFKWRVGMTATPVEEQLHDIYGEMLLIDLGAAFGTRQDYFRREFFYPVGYQMRQWAPKDGACERIVERIAPITFFAERGSYSGLPKLTVEVLEITPPKRVLDVSRGLAKRMVADIDGATVACANAGVLSGKLTQIANGFVYSDDDGVVWIDDHKLRESLADMHENCDGSPVLIVYTHIAQLERLKTLLPELVVLDNKNGKAAAESVIKAWNAGDVRYLALHPKSAGHGLNLQHGGRRILLLSPIWSADMWHQVIGRLHRRGSPWGEVEVVVAVSVGTVEERMLERVHTKQEQAEKFSEFLKSLV